MVSWRREKCRKLCVEGHTRKPSEDGKRKSSKTVNLKGLVRVSAATGRMREWVKTG
jgi:hypothetical protein